MDYIRDCRWFDEKAKSGQLTYEDKRIFFKKVFLDVGINIPHRAREKLEKLLQQSLFDLKSNGNESAHTLAHHMLTCFAPLFVDEQELDKYKERYDDAMKKHAAKCSFKINYKHKG